MITIMNAPVFKLNGRCTGVDALVRNKLVSAVCSSNHWSCSENNSNNSWNVNFESGNLNNNNKNNSNVVRAVSALGEEDRLSWLEAFEDCCRHKLTSPQCVDYRSHFEDDLFKLALEVKGRTYEPSTSTCFIVTFPKLREVFAANFRDRIVHHWVCLRLEPLFEMRFHQQGDVSYNCRKGYGTLAAVNRLKDDLMRISENYTVETWIGKFDLRAFFMSIDRDVLLSLLIPFIRKYYQGGDIDTLIYLTEKIVRHNPQSDCVKKSDPALWEQLPEGKSLFNSHGVGMPIGNLPSQLFANFYLSFMDHIILERCRQIGGAYIRFVDDFCIVSRDKAGIMQIYREVKEWLENRLHLTLHADKVYLQEAKKGVKFVGTVIKPSRHYTSNRTLGNMVNRIRETDRHCAVMLARGVTLERLTKLERMVDSINSYMGFCVHNNSYTIRRNMFRKNFNFWKFCFVSGHFTIVKIRKNFQIRNYLLKKEVNYADNLYRNKTARRRNAPRTGKKTVHYQIPGVRRRRR